MREYVRDSIRGMYHCPTCEYVSITRECYVCQRRSTPVEQSNCLA